LRPGWFRIPEQIVPIIQDKIDTFIDENSDVPAPSIPDENPTHLPQEDTLIKDDEVLPADTYSEEMAADTGEPEEPHYTFREDPSLVDFYSEEVAMDASNQADFYYTPEPPPDNAPRNTGSSDVLKNLDYSSCTNEVISTLTDIGGGLYNRSTTIYSVDASNQLTHVTEVELNGEGKVLMIHVEQVGGEKLTFDKNTKGFEVKAKEIEGILKKARGDI